MVAAVGHKTKIATTNYADDIKLCFQRPASRDSCAAIASTSNCFLARVQCFMGVRMAIVVCSVRPHKPQRRDRININWFFRACVCVRLFVSSVQRDGRQERPLLHGHSARHRAAAEPQAHANSLLRARQRRQRRQLRAPTRQQRHQVIILLEVVGRGAHNNSKHRDASRCCCCSCCCCTCYVTCCCHVCSPWCCSR